MGSGAGKIVNPISVFPGQGSQYVGMAKVVVDAFPYTREIYEEASDSLSDDLYKLCNESSVDTLQLTQNAQPAILTTSYAWFQVLRRELGFSPAAGGGHSLGEYSALVSSGALRLSEGVTLVRKRGQLMQTAVPAGKGKMAAVLGLSDEKVVALCAKASLGADSQVVAANFNAPDQVVIAGHIEAVERAETLAATEPEFKARKVIPLKVSAPFHSPLMNSVAVDFYPFLQSAQWRKPTFPVVSNVDAKVRPDAMWSDLLKAQIDHPVRWTQCTQALAEGRTPLFVEMGPGKVLCGLIKRIIADAKLFSIDSLDDLRKYEKFLKEEAP